MLFRPGPAWRIEAPLDKLPTTLEHASHLQQVYREQKVCMGGSCEDTSDLLSVVVLQAESQTEAFRYKQDHPFVAQGGVEIEIHPWQVVFEPRSAER